MSGDFERRLRAELVGIDRSRRRRRIGRLYPVAFVLLVGAVLLGLGESLLGRLVLLVIALALGAALGIRWARQALDELSSIMSPPEL